MATLDPAPQAKELTPTEALQLLLDQIDYTNSACGVTEMIGALVTPDVLIMCKRSIKLEKERMHASDR